MKLKRLKATEEQDVEVVNRHPDEQERQQISLLIRKVKNKSLPVVAVRQVKS